MLPCLLFICRQGRPTTNYPLQPEAIVMPAKCKTNKRRTTHHRDRIGQRLNKAPGVIDVIKRVWLADGNQAAIASCNGSYMLGLFDAYERPLQRIPMVFTGAQGKANAFAALSKMTDRDVNPDRIR
jgi:hypothetical protein